MAKFDQTDVSMSSRKKQFVIVFRKSSSLPESKAPPIKEREIACLGQQTRTKVLANCALL